jgi:predicted dithiol-disulfide oxidoreductase (DUF899 family)
VEFMRVLKDYRRASSDDAAAHDIFLQVPGGEHSCEAFINSRGIPQLAGICSWLDVLSSKP